MSNLKPIAAPSRLGIVPAAAMKVLLAPCAARIDAGFRLVCASIDQGLLHLPGGSLHALLLWVYANIKLHAAEARATALFDFLDGHLALGAGTIGSLSDSAHQRRRP